MIAVALESERRAWLEAHAHLTDATGRRLVVGNGYLPERSITTGAGQVEVKAPRVADRRREDEREPFSSAILPRYIRKSAKVTVALPVLYVGGCRPGTSPRHWHTPGPISVANDTAVTLHTPGNPRTAGPRRSINPAAPAFIA